MKTLVSLALVVFLAVAAFPASAQAPNAKNPTQTICHVHKEKLKHEWVKVNYGLFYLDENYAQARLSLFPFSNKIWFGGCVMTNHSPQFKKIDYCDKCRSAEWLWKKQQERSGAKASETQ